LGPRAVAGHAALSKAGEDGFGVLADVVVRPKVEVTLHRLAIAFAEEGHLLRQLSNPSEELRRLIDDR
jgi:hypothetical protein